MLGPSPFDLQLVAELNTLTEIIDALREECVSKAGRVLAAPQGFEPRYADPESAVLPLNEGAVLN